jgi:hypothetical protein
MFKMSPKSFLTTPTFLESTTRQVASLTDIDPKLETGRLLDELRISKQRHLLIVRFVDRINHCFGVPALFYITFATARVLDVSTFRDYYCSARSEGSFYFDLLAYCLWQSSLTEIFVLWMTLYTCSSLHCKV